MIGRLRELAMRGSFWRIVAGIALLVGASGLFVVPAVLMMDTSFFNMRSEGSPAGTILFVLAGSIGFFTALGGVACVISAATVLAWGSGSRGPLVVLACIVAPPLVAAAVARNFLAQTAADARDPVKSRQASERNEAYWAARWEGVERIDGGRYRLVWKAHKGQPPVELVLPAEELRPDLDAPPLPDKEGSSPVALPLVTADAGGATLTLYLSDEHVRAILRNVTSLQDPEIAPLWISRKGGEWRYLGIDCRRAEMLGIAGPSAPSCYTPPSRLARLVPELQGLRREVLRGEEYSTSCRMTFPFQGRPAVLESPGSCLGEKSLAALKAAIGLLERLGNDTAAPPPAAERLARVRSATANCEKAGQGVPRTGGDSVARGMRDRACGYAIQLAAREMAEQPDDVAPLLVRSLEAGPPAARQLKAGYIDAVLRGFGAAARKDTRGFVHAHVLRIEAVGSGAAAARPSVEALLARAAELPGPDDPLFERIYDSVRKAPLPPAYASQRLALLASLHEKAAAVDPRSELAWKTRYGACRERASRGVEREALKACADDLVAEWQDRIARKASFEPFDGEPELAVAITRMYAESAEAAPGGGALQGLRRTRELATTRIAPHRTEVFDELDKREAQLAPKAQAAPRRR
jgi:hypothetical protein